MTLQSSAFWSHLGLHVMTVYLVFLVAVLSVSLSQPPSPSCHCQGTVGTDFTLDPEEIGPEVVLATVAKIKRSDVFENDFGFLRRMAAVETDDGSMLGMNGGIWDISKVTYISVNRAMTIEEDGMALSQQLEEHFCISWSSNVSDYDAINVPLFSALTAMARLRLIHRIIPDDIQQQANLWKDVFEHNGDPQDFIDIAQTLADEGLLEAPTEVKLEAVNVESVTLSWSPPFTLEGVPILHYSVYITSQGVSVQRNTTETNITLDRPCASTSYNICAWNAVGKGNTTTYYHTMPEATVKAIAELSQPGVCMSCTFFADSPAEGCGIELQNEQFTFIFNSTRLSERDLVLLQCFSVPQAGEYGVYIYEIQLLGRLELSKRKLNNNIVIYKTELVPPLQAVVRAVNTGICVSCYSPIAEGCALKLKDNINTYAFDVLTSHIESLQMQCFSVPTTGVFSVFVYEVWGNGSLSERALVLPDVSLSLDTQSQDNVHCYSISVVSGFISVLSVTVFALFVVVSIAIASILRSRIRQNKGDKEVQQNVDGEPFYDVVGTTDRKTTKIELNANAAYGKPHNST